MQCRPLQRSCSCVRRCDRDLVTTSLATHVRSVGLASSPFFHCFEQIFDFPPLEWKPYRVQEWSEIVSVIVRSIALEIQTWCHGRHLVSIDGVELHEIGHFLIDLSWCFVSPLGDQPLEHAHHTELVRLGRRPSIDSSSYVKPMSISSDWT